MSGSDSDNATPAHIALIGLSGSGKSTVAPMLAARRGDLVVVDLDRVVEQRCGRSVQDIFDTDGEAGFRSAESEALASALNGPPAAIATGGGVVLAAENRSLLREGATTVWLRAHPDLLAQRLNDTTEARPLLEGDAEFALRRLSAEREALYSEVADVVIDVDGLDPLSVLEELCRELE